MRIGISQVHFSFLGLALARAWVALVFADPLSPGYGDQWGTLFFDVAYVAAALTAAFGFRLVIPLTGRRWSWLLSGSLMVTASVGFVLDGLIGPTTALFVALSLVGGAGFLLYTLVNAEVLATQSLRSIILYLSLGRILSFVLTFFLSDMGPDRLYWAVLALPVVALLMTRSALQMVPDRQRPKNACPQFRMPWVLLLVLAVYSFVYGLHQESLTPGVGRYASLFNCVTGLLLVLWVLLAPGKLSFRVLCGIPIVFLVCGFMLMTLDGVMAGVAADMLIVLAFNLAKMTVVFLFYDMSRRLGISIVVLSASLAAMDAFLLLGHGASYGLAAIAGGALIDVVAHMVVIALALGLTIMALTNRQVFNQWGARVLSLEGESAEEEDARRIARQRSEELAEEWGLSAREKEVLELVAEGKTSRQIQDTLFIAEGTFKTHMRHIYEKSGVHGQKPLRQLLCETVSVTAEGQEAKPV